MGISSMATKMGRGFGIQKQFLLITQKVHWFSRNYDPLILARPVWVIFFKWNFSVDSYLVESYNLVG